MEDGSVITPVDHCRHHDERQGLPARQRRVQRDHDAEQQMPERDQRECDATVTRRLDQRIPGRMQDGRQQHQCDCFAAHCAYLPPCKLHTTVSPHALRRTAYTSANGAGGAGVLACHVQQPSFMRKSLTSLTLLPMSTQTVDKPGDKLTVKPMSH